VREIETERQREMRRDIKKAGGKTEAKYFI